MFVTKGVRGSREASNGNRERCTGRRSRRCSTSLTLLDKTSHGDVDITIAFDCNNSSCEEISKWTEEDIVDEIAKALGDDEDDMMVERRDRVCVSNISTMYSILTPKERFQIDLKFVDPRYFATSVAAVSHGHFIHLLNMMLKPQALAFKERGLHMVLTSNQKQKQKPADNTTLVTENVVKMALFFGLPEEVFDGTTRFTSSEIVDFVMESSLFDIRPFHRNLASRKDLINKPIFRALLDRISSLEKDKDEYLKYCRDIKGEKKAGRCAAGEYGFDFDKLKNRAKKSEQYLQARKALHNGVFVSWVPELRYHKEVLNEMLELVSRSPEVVGECDEIDKWDRVIRFYEENSDNEKKAIVSKIAMRAIASRIGDKSTKHQRLR